MAEELIPIFFFMCVAGVLILRPMTKKLGLLIEAMARERLPRERPLETGLSETQVERITVSLERLNARLDRVDDRINFMERLVEDRSTRQRLTG